MNDILKYLWMALNNSLFCNFIKFNVKTEWYKWNYNFIKKQEIKLYKVGWIKIVLIKYILKYI